jgi:hypothetical protein
MLRRLRVRSVLLAVAAVAAAAAAPGVASAQTETALSGVFTDTNTSATGPAGGLLSVTSFAAEGRTLVLNGTGHVSFCIPDVDPKNCLVSLGFSVTTTVTDVSGTCDAIVVTLDAIHTVAGGGRFVLDLTASPLVLTGGSEQFRCAIARRAASNEPLYTLAASLNRLL